MIVVNYTASNTDLQIIDTFDLPTVKTLYCEIHAADRNDTSLSKLSINHNGIDISEVQTAFSTGNNRPAEFITDISNNVGRILVQPQVAPVDYNINKTIVEPTLYSENTVSGRLIKATEGIAIYNAGNANNMSIRQSNNNFFGYVNTFLQANTLGPIVTKAEFFNANNLISYNDSNISQAGNVITITPSASDKSHNYLEVTVEPGTVYRVTCNAYYLFETVHAKEDTFDVGARLTVGSSAAGSDIVFQDVTQIDTQYILDFIPTTDKIYVGFGYGSLGTNLKLENVSVRELVPFHTYSQHTGTFYVKYPAVQAGNTILQIGNNRIFVDASNNIFVNTVNCGSQQNTNKISFKYTSNTITYCLNGSQSNQQSATYFGNTRQLMFQSGIDEFSYTPILIANNIQVGLTNV